QSFCKAALRSASGTSARMNGVKSDSGVSVSMLGNSTAAGVSACVTPDVSGTAPARSAGGRSACRFNRDQRAKNDAGSAILAPRVPRRRQRRGFPLLERLVDVIGPDVVLQQKMNRFRHGYALGHHVAAVEIILRLRVADGDVERFGRSLRIVRREPPQHIDQGRLLREVEKVVVGLAPEQLEIQARHMKPSPVFAFPQQLRLAHRRGAGNHRDRQPTPLLPRMVDPPALEYDAEANRFGFRECQSGLHEQPSDHPPIILRDRVNCNPLPLHIGGTAATGWRRRKRVAAGRCWAENEPSTAYSQSARAHPRHGLAAWRSAARRSYFAIATPPCGSTAAPSERPAPPPNPRRSIAVSAESSSKICSEKQRRGHRYSLHVLKRSRSSPRRWPSRASPPGSPISANAHCGRRKQRTLCPRSRRCSPKQHSPHRRCRRSRSNRRDCVSSMAA